MRIDLLGASFNITTDENPEAVQKALDLLSSTVEDIRRQFPSADSLKVAIIAGLQLADDLVKQRSILTGTFSDDDAQKMVEITEQLIRKIDSSLI